MSKNDVLADRNAKRVRRATRLAGRQYRKKVGLTRAEGPQAVLELLRNRPELVREVFIEDSVRSKHPEIVQLATANHDTYLMTSKVSESITVSAQGVLAVLEVTPASKLPGAAALAVILPRTQDPGNLGTLIRLADAFGAEAVLVGPNGADPFGPKVIRASAGSVFHLPIISDIEFDDAVAQAHARQMRVVGTGLSASSRPLSQTVLAGPMAWVFGNEARGLTDAELQACDEVVRIEMNGRAESLNVAAAAAICLYEGAAARGGA